MSYIFLDESGDLGFKKRSSRWFIFTIAITLDKRVLERVIKKVWTPLRRKHKRLGELHAYRADDITRRRVLRGVSEIGDLKVLCIILNKQKVHVDLQNQKNYLYNYTANILLERLHNSGILKGGELLKIFIDRKDTKKKVRQNFIDYLTKAMGNHREDKISVELHTSHENKSLQAIDFISWAIFRKYEKGDYEFYEIVKDKIVDEKVMFP